MSILIKGMEKLPRQGAGIGLMIFSDGRVDTFCIDNNGETTMFLSHTDFRAVEVPTPHGDLIDRDVVRRKYQKMATDAYTVNIKAKMETVINACIDQLEYAQTVIESEE